MKTIELIDKYEIRQSDDPDYNPPNYRWIDNTGELIRCGECKHFNDGDCTELPKIVNEMDYCSFAERKKENGI